MVDGRNLETAQGHCRHCFEYTPGFGLYIERFVQLRNVLCSIFRRRQMEASRVFAPRGGGAAGGPGGVGGGAPGGGAPDGAVLQVMLRLALEVARADLAVQGRPWSSPAHCLPSREVNLF
jgi:hypothetical protein